MPPERSHELCLELRACSEMVKDYEGDLCSLESQVMVDDTEVNRHMLKQKQRQMAAAKAIKSFWTKRAGDWLVNRNRDEDDETGSLDFSLDYIRETVLRSKFRKRGLAHPYPNVSTRRASGSSTAARGGGSLRCFRSAYRDSIMRAIERDAVDRIQSSNTCALEGIHLDSTSEGVSAPPTWSSNSPPLECSHACNIGLSPPLGGPSETLAQQPVTSCIELPLDGRMDDRACEEASDSNSGLKDRMTVFSIDMWRSDGMRKEVGEQV